VGFFAEPGDVVVTLRNHAVDERQILAELIHAVHHAILTTARTQQRHPIVAND
jgi:hypothetical protein